MEKRISDLKEQPEPDNFPLPSLEGITGQIFRGDYKTELPKRIFKLIYDNINLSNREMKIKLKIPRRRIENYKFMISKLKEYGVSF